MKIRNGFVSNSSSSSFIITGNRSQIIDSIENMIGLVNGDNENGHPEHLAGMAKFKGDENLQDRFIEGRIGIAFTSINYDTYIRVYTNGQTTVHRAYVETCNNHDWYGVIDNSRISHMSDEDDNDYNSMYHNNREIGANFIWLSEDCKIRSAEHHIYNRDMPQFKCDCKDGSSHIYLIRFDENLRARCARCDAPINETKTARDKRLKKPQDEPEHIVPGVI